MTDEFLTKGLESDRYLKAQQLITQFEADIEAVLGEFGQRLIEQHPQLFDQPLNPNAKSASRSSTVLAYHRINYPLNGPRAPATDQRRRLNVHLYWMPPTEYGRTDIDGALRAFGYKIKDADAEIDNHVSEQTRAEEWSVETSGNPFDSNTVFYRHVSSAADIEAAADTLVEHFSRFGDAYAADADGPETGADEP